MVKTEPLEGEAKSIILPQLNNQLEVNRWFLEQIDKLESGRFVKKDGGDSMEGPLEVVGELQVTGGADFHYTRINKVADPQDIYDAVNKKYIDDKASFLQGEIVDLEEEIEAIIPSVERGAWKFVSAGAVTGPGIFTAYDQPIATAGNPTGLYQDIKSIWFHSTDAAGIYHSFGNVKEDNLLELFENGSDDFGLYEVTAVHDQTDGAGDYWVIDVNFVRTLDATDRIENGDTCRLKIFNAPDGGTADGFVMKSGDTMEGNLTLEKGSILVEEGDVTVETGNITLEDINAKVFTNNVENTSASEYVKILKDGNLKAAFKDQEIVSYQPHTYPNNIAADVSATGTDQTLIHKGYVDDSLERALFAGQNNNLVGETILRSSNTSKLTIRNAANNSSNFFRILSYSGSELFGIDGDGMIRVPKTPTQTTHVANKKYVDDSVKEVTSNAAAKPPVVLIGSSCKWRKNGLNESSLSGYQYFGIEQAGTTSSSVGSGNVLYLNKLIAIDGTLQSLENYTPTEGSLIEVYYGNELYFKGLLDPTTYKVASRNFDEIVCDFTTNYPLVAKSGSNWSTSTVYNLILTGLVKK